MRHINNIESISNGNYLIYPVNNTKYQTFLNESRFSNIHQFIFNQLSKVNYDLSDDSGHTAERELNILNLMNETFNGQKQPINTLYTKDYIPSRFTKVGDNNYTITRIVEQTVNGVSKEVEETQTNVTLNELINLIFEKTIYFSMHLFY